MKFTPFEKKLLNRVQAGLPLQDRPFKKIADELGTSEGKVISAIRSLKARRIIRRLGGIFSSRKLGYTTTLVIGAVPERRLKRAVEIVNEYSEVTHNYLRECRYNLWFTIVAPSKRRASEIIREIRQRTGIQDFHELPSERFYKLDLQLSF